MTGQAALGCSERRLIDRHFSGSIVASEEAALRAHLPACARCRKRYERHMLYAELVPGRPRMAERLAVGLGVGGAAPAALAPQRARTWPTWALTASLAASDPEQREKLRTKAKAISYNLASFTWAHSIDDSSDLQTLLKPQDNTNFAAERGDSLFDQRHRFVVSGVFTSPNRWKDGDWWQKVMWGFTFSPIVEYSSGRPFNILAIGDANGDFQSTNERPTVLSDGTLCQTGVDPGCLQGVFPANGNLSRNMGLTHDYFSFDARLTRRIRFNERVSLDLIVEGFNLFNRFNEAAANPFYQVVNAWGERAGGKYYSQPTSSFDPRQFQFGFKLLF